MADGLDYKYRAALDRLWHGMIVEGFEPGRAYPFTAEGVKQYLAAQRELKRSCTGFAKGANADALFIEGRLD